MSYKNGLQYTDFKRINLKADGGLLRFEDITTAPTSASGEYLLYVDGGVLYYDNGSSATALGSGGGGSSSLDGAYDVGRTITVNQGAVTMNGVAETTAVLSLTGDGDSSGALLKFAHTTTSRNDILGTGSSWKVTGLGAATLLSVTAPTIVAGSAGNVNLTIDAYGTGTIAIGATSTGAVTITPALTATASITITGTADTDVFTITNGDVVVTLGSVSITDNDNVVSLKVTNNTATSVGAAAATGVVEFASTSLTTGTLLHLELTEGTLNGGYYMKAWDVTAGAAVFTLGENGEITITGTASGTDAITVTAGDILLSSGAFDMTVGDMTLADGSISITDADNAASFTVINNTATSATVVSLSGSGVFTGSTTTSWMTITPSGLTTGTAVYAVGAGLTEGKVLHLATDATMTTGNILYVQDTGANSAITSGTLATFDLTSTAITGTVNKIGKGVEITSSRTTTTGTVADDWDLASIIRTDIINGAGSMSATGSVLYIENAVTNTSGTVSDTVNGVEVVMDSLGTGDGVKITHAATGGKALNIISSATTASCVLITGSGVKADNKASLEVVNTGATAAGGSTLRVTNTGTPAAATSYLVDFDYGGATMTNNPTTVYINGKDSTNSTVEINSSGASAANKGMLSLLNSNTGATGVVLHSQHTSTGSAANSDDIFMLKMEGLDSGDAVTEYCRLTAEIQVVTAGQEDGRFLFSAAADNGTLTQMATLNPRAGGALAEFVVGSGAGVGYITSSGAYDLVLDTNQGTNAGNITLTDGAAGAITLAPSTTGKVVVTPASGAALTTAMEVSVGDLKITDGELLLVPSAGLTADVGSAQGGGAITRSFVEIATVGTTGDSVTLPAAAAGRVVIITNHGANAADVFPASGDAINEGSADVATAIAANETLLCLAYDATNWEVLALARN